MRLRGREASADVLASASASLQSATCIACLTNCLHQENEMHAHMQLVNAHDLEFFNTAEDCGGTILKNNENNYTRTITKENMHAVHAMFFAILRSDEVVEHANNTPTPAESSATRDSWKRSPRLSTEVISTPRRPPRRPSAAAPRAAGPACP